MHEEDERLLRTFVEYLIAVGQREVAAACVDAEVDVYFLDDYAFDAIYLDLPPAAYNFIARNEQLKQVASVGLRAVCSGHIRLRDGCLVEEVEIKFRMKKLAVEPGWQDTVREMIQNYKGSNQGLVTQMLSGREGRPVITYNELKYASKSEVKIAMELEARNVLFFPLAVGVRAESGEAWKDHREVDFLVCQDGVWGILEVSYHEGRYEKDSEKAAWFKKSGILCVEHRTAEACYNTPGEVVDEFLGILAKHKR